MWMPDCPATYTSHNADGEPIERECGPHVGWYYACLIAGTTIEDAVAGGLDPERLPDNCRHMLDNPNEQRAVVMLDGERHELEWLFQFNEDDVQLVVDLVDAALDNLPQAEELDAPEAYRTDMSAIRSAWEKMDRSGKAEGVNLGGNGRMTADVYQYVTGPDGNAALGRPLTISERATYGAVCSYLLGTMHRGGRPKDNAAGFLTGCKGHRFEIDPERLYWHSIGGRPEDFDKNGIRAESVENMLRDIRTLREVSCTVILDEPTLERWRGTVTLKDVVDNSLLPAKLERYRKRDRRGQYIKDKDGKDKFFWRIVLYDIPPLLEAGLSLSNCVRNVDYKYLAPAPGERRTQEKTALAVATYELVSGQKKLADGKSEAFLTWDAWEHKLYQGIDDTSNPRIKRKRIQDEICKRLDLFKEQGLITGWERTADKRGVRITWALAPSVKKPKKEAQKTPKK